jgi:hypothetical protein
MSARRFAWILAAALAVIAVAIWLSAQRHLERDIVTGDLVLPGLQAGVNTVTTVTLAKGDGTHTTLRKDGSLWSVAQRGWPADLGKVRKLLLELAALNIVEEKTRLPANYPQLGVEDVSSPKASGVQVSVASPARSWALILGKSSGGKSGYVRIAGAPQSLLAAPLVSTDADPKSWLQHDLIDVSAARVREVQEKPAQGAAFSAVREKPADSNFSVSPLPKGRTLTGPEAAAPIAGALSALTLDDVHKTPGSPDAHSAHAVFLTFDGLQVDLTGRKDGTHALVSISVRSTAKETAAEAQTLTARCNGWEFEIADYKYAAIFTPLEELLVKPPEPAKKSARPATAAPAAPTAR